MTLKVNRVIICSPGMEYFRLSDLGKHNITKACQKFFSTLFLLSFYALNAQVNFTQTTNTGFIRTIEKNDSSVSLVYKDTLVIPSLTEFNMPVIMKSANEISAISLGFYYPEEYLEITGMELADGRQGFSYSATDGLFSVAWSDVNPISISDEGTIITLRMKSLDLAGLTGTIKFGIYELSEFADSSANVIDGVVLEIPEIQYLAPDIDDSLAGNYVYIYPNPFNDYTSINFYLKADSKVKISVFNVAGMKILQLPDATYTKGTHQVKLHAIDLSIGIYLLKFEINNEEQSSSKLIKIMSIR